MPGLTTVSDQIALGPDAKVDLTYDGTNYEAFRVIEGSYSDSGQEADVTDSESATQTASAVGLQTFSLSATIQLDQLDDPWESWEIAPGLVVGVRLYPWGRIAVMPNGGKNYFDIPALRLASGSGQFTVQGSRPQTFRIDGKNDSNGGYYTRPGAV